MIRGQVLRLFLVACTTLLFSSASAAMPRVSVDIDTCNGEGTTMLSKVKAAKSEALSLLQNVLDYFESRIRNTPPGEPPGAASSGLDTSIDNLMRNLLGNQASSDNSRLYCEVPMHHHFGGSQINSQNQLTEVLYWKRIFATCSIPRPRSSFTAATRQSTGRTRTLLRRTTIQ